MVWLIVRISEGKGLRTGDCAGISVMLQNGKFQSQIPENDYTQLFDIIPMAKTKVNNHS
jgi:hypothetical protein